MALPVGNSWVTLVASAPMRYMVIETFTHGPRPVYERARDRGFDLLTGDASRDETLDLCNLGAAHSLVALTNVDTLHLEIAPGPRVRTPNMPIVLRIA